MKFSLSEFQLETESSLLLRIKTFKQMRGQVEQLKKEQERKKERKKIRKEERTRRKDRKKERTFKTKTDEKSR